jgi:hypothetical protein
MLPTRGLLKDTHLPGPAPRKRNNPTEAPLEENGTYRVDQPFIAINPTYRHCEYSWSISQVQIRSSLTRIGRSP